MKIAILEGSPNRDGSSHMLAEEFARGAKEAGHEITAISAAHSNISPCTGCVSSGYNGPCVQKDDMEHIRKEILGADMLVFVTPLYYYGMSAQLKILIDRFCAINGSIQKKKMNRWIDYKKSASLVGMKERRLLMKKLFSVFVILALVLGLAACGSKNDGEGASQGTAPESAAQAAGDEGNAHEGADGIEASSDTQEAAQTEEPGEPSPEETGEAGTKALVVYFSATGNTKAVAETLAELSGADIYEIVPKQPYTDEDLNYNDRSTRATAEQNDPDARPAISGSITDFEQYKVVYVGYPIWWGDMPRILYTFFDAYDFSGKTIAPFCTSGGSGLSGTPGAIADLETGAEVLDGLHISDSAAGRSESSVSQWLADIGQAE